jgi:preprotein translocase subunit SecA
MAGRGTDIQLGGNLEFRIEDELKADVPEGPERDAAIERMQGRNRRRQGKVLARAASASSAPSGTRAAASTTSCAAAPAVRATPASRASTCRLEDDLLRIFGPDTLFAR